MKIDETIIRNALRNTVVQKKKGKPEQTRAAVLIPIISTSDRLELLLTRRTDRVEHHKNQISFPGGAVDSDDKSIIDAALRETKEELGILPDDIDVIGMIDEVTTPSRFLITPIVGILNKLPPLTLNTIEVKDAFTVPLSFFVDSKNVRVEMLEYEGIKREVYFYEYGDKTIWGVTAYMIQLLLRCIQDTYNPNS